MLQFFRKHQKGFFLFTTICIVFSFAFFGTFQSFIPQRGQVKDLVVFQTLDGKKVKQSTFTHLTHFLANEPVSVPIPRPPLADNILNDGVITKDFLETGLALRLFQKNPTLFHEELSSKHTKEQSYTPYVHPKVPLLSAEKVWGVFAAELPEKLAAHKKAAPLSSEGFESRIALCQAEKQFPAPVLGQVLRYQQKDLPNIPFDARLYKDEVSLFGYHNLSDWFGQAFIDEIAKCILNGAALAKQQGFRVTRDEALTDLLYRSERGFQAAKEQLHRPIPNSYAFFQELARVQGVDTDALVSLWQDVLLFRRLFDGASASAMVDTLPFEAFYGYANEYATIELSALPPELQFHTYEEMEQFEAYLDAVALERELPLELPTAYAPIETIEARFSQLVGRTYRLDVASITRDDLRGKVSLKETWEWELADENWETLSNHFPELAQTEAKTPEERLALLEKNKRHLIDAFAEKKIIEGHLDSWIEQALIAAKPREKTYFLRKQSPFPGIADLPALQALLDTQDEISHYTQDGKTFYTISVLERSPEKEVLSFAQTKAEGITLKKSGECSALVEAIYTDARSQELIEHEMPKELRANFVPPYRFAAHLRDHPEGSLFCPVKKSTETVLRSADTIVPLDEVIALEPGALSSVRVASKEGAYRFRFLDKKVDKTVPIEKMLQAQHMLAREAKKDLFDQLLQETLR